MDKIYDAEFEELLPEEPDEDDDDKSDDDIGGSNRGAKTENRQ